MAEFRIPLDELRHALAVVFAKAGMSAGDAATMADCLLWAEARGVQSHGVEKVARYLELLDSGAAKARPELTVTAQRAGTALVGADRALGPVALSFAMTEALRLARSSGVAWVSVRNTLHAGAIGYYAEQAARENMIAIVLVAGMPNMAYNGARGAAVATSPIAIAVPRANGEPVLLDMATASIALGRIAIHRKTGEPLPDGTALDADGRPTVDPASAIMPTPMAGPKGAGLSIMIELLTSVLAAAPIVGPFHHQRPGARRHRQNAALIVADIAAWGDMPGFLRDVEDAVEGLKQLPRNGEQEILMPGERGSRLRSDRARGGVPVDPEIWRRLHDAGAVA